MKLIFPIYGRNRKKWVLAQLSYLFRWQLFHGKYSWLVQQCQSHFARSTMSKGLLVCEWAELQESRASYSLQGNQREEVGIPQEQSNCRGGSLNGMENSTPAGVSHPTPAMITVSLITFSLKTCNFCYFFFLRDQVVRYGCDFYKPTCNSDSLKLCFASSKSSASKAHPEIEVSA